MHNHDVSDMFFLVFDHSLEGPPLLHIADQYTIGLKNNPGPNTAAPVLSHPNTVCHNALRILLPPATQ